MEIGFDKLFWFFVFNSVFGVFLEGFFCMISQKHWETHVLSVWGWFNFLYGLGAICFFAGAAKLADSSLLMKVVILTGVTTSIELLAGVVLKYGLGMAAWDYSDQFLNLDGIICPLFSLAWAVPAFAVSLGYRKLSRIMDPLKHRGLHAVAVGLCVFLALDFILAAVCIVRWSARHYGKEAHTKFGRLIDRKATDDWMSRRFVEWKFLR